MMKEDNRGISLAEIMVVIAIMSVVLSVGIWTLNATSGKPAQQCSQKIIYSLERARVTAMGKGDMYYRIYIAGDGRVLCEEGYKSKDTDPYVVSTSEIGTKRVHLSYVYTSGAGGGTVLMNPGDMLEIHFNRGSGAFSKFYSGHYDGSSVSGLTELSNVTQLISQSGGRVHTVRVVKLTGKVYLD